jgi:hypothetical protein
MPEMTEVNTKTFSKDRRPPAQGLNPKTPEYKAGVLTTHQEVRILMFSFKALRSSVSTQRHLQFYTKILAGPKQNRSRDSSVGIATRLRAGRPRSRVPLPAGGRNISLLHNVHTVSRAHPASYAMSTVGLLPGGKAVEA